jgi:hypothetical protein
VSRVLDNKAQILVSREIETELDMCDAADVDGVIWISSERASGVGVKSRHACAALEEGPHVGCWVACAVGVKLLEFNLCRQGENTNCNSEVVKRAEMSAHWAAEYVFELA